MDIVYSGEHSIAGFLGNAFIIISFLGALTACVSYFLSAKHNDASWRKLGRIGFRIHTAAVVGVIFTLYYLLVDHAYEFQYIWKHSNNIMPFRYIISCFWGGQEGSLILWIFWHAVLANILILKAGKWESSTMTVFSGIQVFLASMLVGAYFIEYQFGINPFLLAREAPENFGMPWTLNAGYITDFPLFQDGKGLNPLLQNYWMIIHPPTLFLGFASTAVPFVYAIAGLWRKDISGWIKPALPWAFFSVMILGTGILMGGAWAYEALSFGGFWAWDPVENTSLVPWLVLVGGAHLMLINSKKQTSIFTAILLILLSFLLVLYSSLLTRSGLLGETSVHSFVDSGILPQLLIFTLFFFALAVGLLLKKKHRKQYWIINGVLFFAGLVLQLAHAGPVIKIPVILFVISSFTYLVVAYKTRFRNKSEEENLWSREFWIFVGSLVLFLSSLQITVWTSLPILNEFLEPFSGFFASIHESTNWEFFGTLADHNFAPPTDRIYEYNRWQIPFAVIVTLLIACGQFFRYKNTDIRKFLKNISLAFVVAAILTMLMVVFTGFKDSSAAVNAMLFSTIFAIVANSDYLIRAMKGKIRKSGSSIAHVGFALLLLGALWSTSQSDIISKNSSIYDVKSLSKEMNNDEDIVMFANDTLKMGEYFASYRGREVDGINLMFAVDYYEQVPHEYLPGDIVVHNDMVFECISAHSASPSFIEDMEEHWSFLPFPAESQVAKVRRWLSGDPGELLFTLKPRVQLNEQMGNTPEPDTKHYLNRDIYTHIKWGKTEEPETDPSGYLKGVQTEVLVGDTIIGMRSKVIVDSLVPVKPAEKEKYMLLNTDIAARAVLRILEGDRDTVAHPLFILRDSSLVVPDLVEIEEFGLRFSLGKIDPISNKITLNISEHERNQRDFIVMQAIMFPYINLLWAGCLIMILGTMIAMAERIRVNRKTAKE